MALDYSTLLPIVLGIVIAYAFLQPRQFTSQLRGPPSTSWLYGHMREVFLSLPYGKYEFEWQKLYGMAYRVKGCFGSEALIVSDSSALRYIVNNPSMFRKPPHIQWINHIGFGSGSLLTATGEQHRRLRSMMNPVFSAMEVRKLVPAIQKVAWDASRRLSTICDESATQQLVDIHPLLHEITLQTVGEGIMGFNFAADKTFAECYKSFVLIISKRSNGGLLADAILPRLPNWVTSLLAYFPPPDLAWLLKHREITNRIAQSVLENKIEAQNLGVDPEDDLFSKLVHNNAQASDKMSFEEIKDQFGTINAAGEETTANALSWAFYQLAGNSEWQSQLREELLQFSSSILQGDYDSLPFLNAIIKETMRFHSTVPNVPRIVYEDAVIPLSQPITTNSGKEVTEIIVKKGQQIYVSIQAYHRSTFVWGEDADQFKPSRWLQNDPHPLDGSAIGPYSNLISFWGGPRTCIGWRFAILEMQVMLCELISKFSFEMTPNEFTQVHQSFAITTVPADASGKVGLRVRIRSL